MKILITGCGGFIGGRLLARLRSAGPEFELLAPRRSELDLADGDAVAHYLQTQQPDRVVHLAASIVKSENEAGRAAQWRDTFEAGRNLIDAAAAGGVRHLIAAGTVAELGDAPGILSADLPAAPQSTYGLCKSLLREIAAHAARRHPLRVDWLRPFTVYGPGQSGAMLIPAAIKAARSGLPADFTDGLQQRDFLFIDDLLDWFELALRLELPAVTSTTSATFTTSAPFHIHHLGTGEGTPVREVLSAVAAANPGARFNLGAIPRRQEEPPVQVAPVYAPEDEALRGWKAKVGIKEGLARTLAAG